MHVHRRVALLGVLLLIALSACSQFRASDAQIAEELDDAEVTPTFAYLESGDRATRYMLVGTDDQPRVLFIHGGPGSLDAFNPYFEIPELRAAAQLVSVDRPGYAYSNYGRTEPDLAHQAELIRPLVVPGTVIVGHSFGGTLAVQLAMDQPELVRALVLIAPSLSPEHERVFFFNRPMERRALNWLMPTAWKVSNTEKLAQIDNLKKMLPLWPRVTMPVSIIHATGDGVVPLEHSEFAVDHLPPDTTTLEILDGGGHFILWSEIDIITQAILRQLQ